MIRTSTIPRPGWSLAARCVLLALGHFFYAERSAFAAAKDEAATRLADQAIEEDYLGGKPKAAEAKLKRALKQCGKNGCSSAVSARVYRDLGIVYIAMKRGQDAREAFAHSVQADPEIRLEKELATPEAEQAFVEMGGQRGYAKRKRSRAEKPKKAKPIAKAKPAPPPKRAEPEGDLEEEEIVLEEESAGDAEGGDEQDASSAGKSGALENYFSFTVQQDFLMHGAQARACYSGRYTCFDASGELSQPIYEGAGNEVSGGLGMATTRFMLGYDRLFWDNVLLGARIGFAIGGGPTPTSTEDSFLPLHLELRAAYHLFDRPFTRDGLRPYASLGFGVAEVDDRVRVQYFQTEAAAQRGEARTLDAWAKRGKTFIAPGIGSTYAFGTSSSVLLELRGTILLGTSGFAPSLGLAYVHAL